MMKKVSFIITLAVMLWTGLVTAASAEDIDWNKRLTSGTNIAYWIDSGCEYTVSIPNAVNKLMNPSGMTNPLIISKTTVKSSSKMDFYQNYVNNGIYASTSVFRKNSSGVYYQMPVSEKDTYDWVYGEIKINDYKMGQLTSTPREKVIIHEMLHVYGLKDLYLYENRSSIMYGYSDGTATTLTSDANNVLKAKY
ncbi:hypothetical protein [Mesobacillus subterraneus]|uniref:Peptidase M10 metallopeptidase domain-containing protein n=1 Tax=Mesobacillus subterraneus TaxID=285983 RepID=A0A3R9EUK4_9BACI|nr:hypothetical protein [Mesobacillus subterraneus]RSD21090.1 hypothetical protein EJA10_22595 [Mesobacillus subterraneus]